MKNTDTFLKKEKLNNSVIYNMSTPHNPILNIKELLNRYKEYITAP